MMISFYSLPDDILRQIFLFDSTYKNIFTNSVLPLIPLHCVYNAHHLIFRAKDRASDRSYLIYDCTVNMEEGYVYGKMLEAHQNDFLNQNDVIGFSFVHQKKIVRFLTFTPHIEKNTYNNEMRSTEFYFILEIQPLLTINKHNHIFDFEKIEYFYSLTYTKGRDFLPGLWRPSQPNLLYSHPNGNEKDVVGILTFLTDKKSIQWFEPYRSGAEPNRYLFNSYNTTYYYHNSTGFRSTKAFLAPGKRFFNYKGNGIDPDGYFIGNMPRFLSTVHHK